jgi:hypothetical protein
VPNGPLVLKCMQSSIHIYITKNVMVIGVFQIIFTKMTSDWRYYCYKIHCIHTHDLF